jgi:hypothetical protein
MNDRDWQIIELILNRRQAEARGAAGMDFARHQAERVRESGAAADSSRWWMTFSQVAEGHGKAFIASTSAEIAEVSTDRSAFSALRDASMSFLDYLGGEYERQYRGNRFFHSSKDAKTAPLPPFWQETRNGLELEIEIQQRHFDPPAKADRETAQPKQRWQQQRVTSQQERVMEYLVFRDCHLAGGSSDLWDDTKLRNDYAAWNAKQKPKLDPFKRTAFNKWLNRYYDGWRVDGSRWHLTR